MSMNETMKAIVQEPVDLTDYTRMCWHRKESMPDAMADILVVFTSERNKEHRMLVPRYGWVEYDSEGVFFIEYNSFRKIRMYDDDSWLYAEAALEEREADNDQQF